MRYCAIKKSVACALHFHAHGYLNENDVTLLANSGWA